MFASNQQPGDRSHYDSDARAAAAYDAAHTALQSELVDALISEPSRIVPPPGWKSPPPQTALDIFKDALCGSKSLADAMVKLLADCQRHADPLIRLQAMAVLSMVGKSYADYHADGAE